MFIFIEDLRYHLNYASELRAQTYRLWLTSKIRRSHDSGCPDFGEEENQIHSLFYTEPAQVRAGGHLFDFYAC